MKTLFLAWQAQESRKWYPVGRLDADMRQSFFVFQYTHGALDAGKAEGFHPVAAFPVMDQRYESSELFPLFQNRVIKENRRDFAGYLQSLDMPDDAYDPMAILAVTGGERQTDNFEVFSPLEKDADNRFICRFFLHGIRHCNETARQKALALETGDMLQVALELNNPTGMALQLESRDYHVLGRCPRYLIHDLRHVTPEYEHLTARVVRNNGDGTPLNRRILIELSGVLPADYQPMSDKTFQVIPTPP